MTTFSDLCAIAFHGERVTSRRVALRSGVTEEAALHATLAQAAGDAGLGALVAKRLASKAADQERAAARVAHKRDAVAQRTAGHAKSSTPWRAWFDGSAHPNPGRCGIGALLVGPDGEKIEISQAAGYGNSSEAEYLALIAALEAARKAGVRGLTLFGDSQVVINDVTGSDARAAPSLGALRATARALIDELGGVVLRWIPRHRNGEADSLSQRAVAGWVE